MPPFVPRKRSRTPDEAVEAAPPAKKRAVEVPKAKQNIKAKQTLFDAVDSPTSKAPSIDKSRRLLNKLVSEDDDSSESEVDSDEFEDILHAGPSKTSHSKDDGEESEVEWEDVVKETADITLPEAEIEDVSVTIRDDGTFVEPLVSAATGKKGPSKRERHIRVLTHVMHVKYLVWHNTLRNSWANDKEVQKILVDALTPTVLGEITRWRRSMGMLSKQELEKDKAATARRAKNQSKRGRSRTELKGRDWSYSAEYTEVGNVDLSQGDPLHRLLRFLAAYWQTRFTITAPGLRKRGYMPMRQIKQDVESWKKNKGQEQFGERIIGIEGFRELARNCEGSRDVGGQLFVALLRGLGFDARMVASLQPIGFGWSKSEEAPTRSMKPKETSTAKITKHAKQLPPPRLREILTPKQSKKVVKAEKPARTSQRGNKAQPINLEESDSPLSDPPSENEDDLDDEIAMIDAQPISKKNPRKYDRDLSRPIYWAEILSPVTNKYIPVDPVVLKTIGTNDDLIATFEPRGSKTDASKQVICYAVAHSADGTAKDVTVRYLKRHQLPGKTKGMRMPIEKVPIANHKGKVVRYEEHDWFAEFMLYYSRPEKERTKADELEDDTDLRPWKPSKEEKVLDKESLAWYKASAEFVLEEHLRREEALLPAAQPVKTFTAGKGEKAKEYSVYMRKDVVNCKTVESWHKEGRGLKPGQQPMKYVPIRAVTLQRKREIEDAQRETGEKLKQGLYSQAQTDWIIPSPIVNGIIPKNAFGNMDVYVPTMVPVGATHLPMKGTAKICKKLEIDYAEACTGFEFGKQRAVPVITGVVVANENAGLVRNAWRIDQAEIRRKEDVKRTAAALHWWRKMLLGIRIIDRMKAEYANTSTTAEEYNPFVRKAAPAMYTNEYEVDTGNNEDTAGGFLPSDIEVVDEEMPDHDTAGGFLLEEEYDDAAMPLTDSTKDFNPDTPVSLDVTQQTSNDRNSKPNKRPARVKKENKPMSKRSSTQGKKGVASRAKANDMPTPSDESESDLEPVSNKHRGKFDIVRARVSPIKSPYFSSQDVDDDGDDDAEAKEVTSIRRTTARTRGKK